MPTAEHDDAFGYADAMACGLAAVVLLLFASLVQLSGGTGASEAYAVVTVEFAFPVSPKGGVSGGVEYSGRPFARIDADGRVTPLGDRLAGTPGGLRAERVTLDTPPDTAPSLNLSLDEWPGLPTDPAGGRFVWRTRLLVRYAAAAESFEWAWRFDPSGATPSAVSVTLVDHTCTEERRSLAAARVATGAGRVAAVRIQVGEGSVRLAGWEEQ